MAVDDFAPRLSFFFNSHNDLFEEVAKYRAARVIWAEAMRDRFGATNEASWKLRFHAQTAGCSLQDKQPELNLIRVAYQALAAVLGGCQSLHTNSMDETLALPSEHAVTLALRTQQILAYETGVTNAVDPLGGSYFVEAPHARCKRRRPGLLRPHRIRRRHDRRHRRRLFPPRDRRCRVCFSSREVDAKRKLIVGLNAFVEPDEKPMGTLIVDGRVEKDQIAALRASRARREAGGGAERCLRELGRAASTSENLIGRLLKAARRLGQRRRDHDRPGGRFRQV